MVLVQKDVDRKYLMYSKRGHKKISVKAIVGKKKYCTDI
jgi:hypothetical protein